jgi:hypothetical protein
VPKASMVMYVHGVLEEAAEKTILTHGVTGSSCIIALHSAKNQSPYWMELSAL